MSVYLRNLIRISLMMMGTIGCADLPEQSAEHALRKTKPLPATQWDKIYPQDLAIILPRDYDTRIAMSESGGQGGRLFREQWLTHVGDIFSVTDVRSAVFQNALKDWQVVSAAAEIKFWPLACGSFSPQQAGQLRSLL